MSNLKRIFRRHTKGSVKEDRRNADLELGHDLPSATLNERPLTPNRISLTPSQKIRLWDHKTPTAAATQQPAVPEQIYHTARSQTLHIPEDHLMSIKSQAPSHIPRSANIDASRANHEPRRSIWTSDSEFSQVENAVLPQRYEVALQAMQNISPGPSTLAGDEQRSGSEQSRPSSERAEMANNEISEELNAYDREEHPTSSDHHIALAQGTHELATFVPNPPSTDLGRFAWTPSHSDDESEDTPSLIIRHKDDKSDNISTSNESPSTPGSSSRYEDPIRFHAGIVDLSSSRPSLSSEYLSRDDASMPYLDVEIPAGDLNLRTSCSLPSSSLMRRSSPITKSSSQKPVPEVGLGRTRSVGNFVHLGSSVSHYAPRMRASSLFPTLVGNKPSGGSRAKLPKVIATQSATSGPGSSQTSSSLSAGPSHGAKSGLMGQVGSNTLSSSSSHVRSPKPPTLCGRRTTVATEEPKVYPRPMLGRANTRLAKAMKEIGVSDKSRLAQAYPIGFAEKDWVTVSDTIEMDARSSGDPNSTKRTGSSLADNSDSGNLSTTKQIQTRIGSINARRLAQQSALPRFHQAFVLYEDAQTGRTISMPQHDIHVESRGAGQDLVPGVENNKYQHPRPLSDRHLNPFKSSPPVMRTPKISSESSIEDRIQASEKPENPTADQTANTDDFDQLVNRYGSRDDTSVYKASSIGLEDLSGMDLQSSSVDRPLDSSGWISTAGDVEGSMKSPPRDRQGSFAKVSVLGSKGNLTGTPEGTGAREVGSSLAGMSSPPQASSPPYQPSMDNAQVNPSSPTPSHRIRLSTSHQSLPSNVSEAQPRKIEFSRPLSNSSHKIKALPAAAASTSPRDLPAIYGHSKANSTARLLSTSADSPLREEPVISSQAHPNTRDSKIRPRDRTIIALCKDVIPIPRVESAHILFYFKKPSSEALERRQQLSTFWLIVICMLPPAAILIGHGFFDGLIEWHADADVDGFTKHSKLIALCWGYGISSASVIALIVVLVKLFHV